jgi:hypothetical protein
MRVEVTGLGASGNTLASEVLELTGWCLNSKELNLAFMRVRGARNVVVVKLTAVAQVKRGLNHAHQRPAT